jgi:hypothetical protein
MSSTRSCMVMIALSLMVTMISVILAIWWWVTRNDISAGCTLGGYMVSVSAVIVGIAALIELLVTKEAWKILRNYVGILTSP